RPGARDFFRWDRKRRTRHGYFHFHIRKHPRDWGKAKDWPLARMEEPGDVLRPLFKYILTWAGNGDPRLIRLTMANMLAAFITGQYSSQEVPRDALPEAVERAWKHIHARIAEDAAAEIGLAELAEAACVTREHLCRLFKSSIGKSPVQTVRLA